MLRPLTTTLTVLVAMAAVVLLATPAVGAPAVATPGSSGVRAMPGVDCTDAPTPAVPGEGLVGFFGTRPDHPAPTADPFEDGASTTMYEQFGFSGLRWSTYDLGCGPDTARDPGAVIGTTVANWMMNIPLSIAALTASLTQIAFEPDFLQVFDPMITKVSAVLSETLFESWMPVVLAALGLLLLIRARRAALASSAAAVGWALAVIVIATVLVRWPVAAGQMADQSVTTTLGSVVNGLNGRHEADPAVSVASNLQHSVLYTAWLAGELGSTDSATAKKYGPQLFMSQTLSWEQAHTLRTNPEEGKKIIEGKQKAFEAIAEKVKDSDPAAYEHLTGRRSDTRIGYAFLATAATTLAVPFLLASALLLIGSYLIVRLAVMLFPAFATLGLFPSTRGIVTGVGQTVGAALINAVVFGAGAAVTIAIIGLILNPALDLPSWFVLVLLPLFCFMMWTALKPFRRLTAMATPRQNVFADGAGAFGTAGRHTGRLLRKAAITGAAAYTGGAAAAATTAGTQQDGDQTQPARPTQTGASAGSQGPQRIEAQPPPPSTASATVGAPPNPPHHHDRTPPWSHALASGPATVDGAKHYAVPGAAPMAALEPPAPAPEAHEAENSEHPASVGSYRQVTEHGSHVAAGARELDEPPPNPPAEARPPAPVDPVLSDGEEIYPLYHPDHPHDPANPTELTDLTDPTGPVDTVGSETPHGRNHDRP